MKCAQCGANNFDWAPRCDHCGVPIKSEAPSPDAFAIGRPPVAGEDAADNPLRGAEFTADYRAASAGVDVTQLIPGRADLPAVMLSLVGVNIIVFLLMVVSGVSPLDPAADALIRWGANYGPAVTHGQWWRLGTSMFLHIGVLHLLMNMYVLYIAGGITERLFGRAGFATLYVLGGCAGSLTSLLWHPNTISAGASGAIFGLYGGLFGFLIARRRDVPVDALQALGKSGLAFVVGNLVIGLTDSRIDMAAHLGGLIAGVPLGLALAQPTGTPVRHRLIRAGLVATIGLVAVAGLATRAPVTDDWRAELLRMAALEGKTSAAFKEALGKLGTSMTSDQFADFVEKALLPPWREERDTIASLRLPAEQRAAAAKVARYMTLQGEAWQLSSQAIKQDSLEIRGQASAKAEEAAGALYAAVPSAATKAELERVQTLNREESASTTALQAAVQRVEETEKRFVTMFNDGLNGVRAGRLAPRDFANLVNNVVIPLWDAETLALKKSPGLGRQSDVTSRLTGYMSLKRDAFLLTAAGIEKNDIELVKKGQAKAAEASQFVKDAKR